MKVIYVVIISPIFVIKYIMYYCFQLLRNLTSDDYADYTRSRINDTHTQDVMYYEPDFAGWEDHGTAHASIFAADGAAVAITSTINLLLVAPLHNQ